MQQEWFGHLLILFPMKTGYHWSRLSVSEFKCTTAAFPCQCGNYKLLTGTFQDYSEVVFDTHKEISDGVLL